MDGLIQLDVNIDSMIVCEYCFLFVLCQNVMYYCTALSAVFDWICTLQVLIMIIIIIIIITNCSAGLFLIIWMWKRVICKLHSQIYSFKQTKCKKKIRSPYLVASHL